MSHPAARTEHSAGGVVFRTDCKDLSVLMIKDRYGHWGFPKGHVEPGETAAEAALREIEEETGIADLTLIEDLETIDWYFRLRGDQIHKFCHFFLFRTSSGDPQPQFEEGIERAEWVNYDDAVDLVSYANARDVLIRGGEAVSRRLRPDAQRAG